MMGTEDARKHVGFYDKKYILDIYASSCFFNEPYHDARSLEHGKCNFCIVKLNLCSSPP